MNMPVETPFENAHTNSDSQTSGHGENVRLVTSTPVTTPAPGFFATSGQAKPVTTPAPGFLATPAQAKSENVVLKAPATSTATDLDKLITKSFIAAGDDFVGDITCTGGLRVCGTVTGSINCRAGVVYVENGGKVTGDILSEADVYIDGSVGIPPELEEGKPENDLIAKITTKVRTLGKVTLMDHCNVYANVLYGKLSTDDDMTLVGVSRKIFKTEN